MQMISSFPRLAAGRARRWWWSGAWGLSAFSVLYFLCTIRLASCKPLWFDEFFTLHLARLASPSELWSALAAGTDFNPPLCHLATWAAHALLGEGPVTTRLPAILGFWVMGLCLFRFVGRRCGPAAAWAALLLPLATLVYPYAYEARPYGLVLGFSGLALVCWQAAAEGERRPLALVGLALSLAAAVCSHYYAVLLFVPLGLGELVRTWSRRRLDVPVWLAFAISAAVLVPLFPLVGAARVSSATFWAQARWGDVGTTYDALLTGVRWPLGAALVVLMLFSRRAHPRLRPGRPVVPDGPPLHEVAAALGLVALPLLGVVLGKLVTGVFTSRYVLPAVLGLSILTAFAVGRRTRGQVFLAAAFAGLFLVAGVRESRRLEEQGRRLEAVCAYLRHNTTSAQRVAVADPHLFVQLAHHAPPDLTARLWYVSDCEGAARYLQRDTAERALQALRRWARVNVMDYGPFLAAHRRFLVYGSGGWLRAALEADGFGLEVWGPDEGVRLFSVSAPLTERDETTGRALAGAVDELACNGADLQSWYSRCSRR